MLKEIHKWYKESLKKKKKNIDKPDKMEYEPRAKT